MPILLTWVCARSQWNTPGSVHVDLSICLLNPFFKCTALSVGRTTAYHPSKALNPLICHGQLFSISMNFTIVIYLGSPTVIPHFSLSLLIGFLFRLCARHKVEREYLQNTTYLLISISTTCTRNAEAPGVHFSDYSVSQYTTSASWPRNRIYYSGPSEHVCLRDRAEMERWC